MIRELDNLDEAEIVKIGRLVQILDKSGFDFMTLEVGSFRLTVGTADAAPLSSGAPAPAPALVHESKVAANVTPARDASGPAKAAAKDVPAAAQAGLIDITATTMGTFYARPDPESAPFVSVGARVDSETTVGLIEVMKLFNGVSAGVSGEVVQICVSDAELVEYGQVLIRVKPDA